MAKYKKKPVDESTNENMRFQASVKRLNNFLAVKEMERRNWAHENFGNPEGKLFTFCRVLIPIFSLYLFVVMFIYCYFRDMQAVIGGLQDNYMGLSYEAETAAVNLIIAFVAAMCLLLFIGNIVLLCKKYYAGSIISLIATLAVAIHVLTQLNIPMPSSNETYVPMYAISSGVFFLLALLICYLLFCKFKAKRTVKKLANEVLVKISRGTNKMLMPDDYSQEIEKYIEKEKNKIVDDMKDKNSYYLRFGDVEDE